jgi:hypothetical protein
MWTSTKPDSEFIDSITRLLEAAKGTQAEYAVAQFLEYLLTPVRDEVAK